MADTNAYTAPEADAAELGDQTSGSESKIIILTGTGAENVNVTDFKVYAIGENETPPIPQNADEEAYYGTCIYVRGLRILLLRKRTTHGTPAQGEFTVLRLTTSSRFRGALHDFATPDFVGQFLYYIPNNTWWVAIRDTSSGELAWDETTAQTAVGSDNVWLGPRVDAEDAVQHVENFDSSKEYYTYFDNRLRVLTNSTYVAGVTPTPVYDWVPDNEEILQSLGRLLSQASAFSIVSPNPSTITITGNGAATAPFPVSEVDFLEAYLDRANADAFIRLTATISKSESLTGTALVRVIDNDGDVILTESVALTGTADQSVDISKEISSADNVHWSVSLTTSSITPATADVTLSRVELDIIPLYASAEEAVRALLAATNVSAADQATIRSNFGLLNHRLVSTTTQIPSNPIAGDTLELVTDLSSLPADFSESGQTTPLGSGANRDKFVRTGGTSPRWWRVQRAQQVTGGSGTAWSQGTSFPSSPTTGQYFYFTANVSSGLTWQTADGTALTAASAADIARWNGTAWVYAGNWIAGDNLKPYIHFADIFTPSLSAITGTGTSVASIGNTTIEAIQNFVNATGKMPEVSIYLDISGSVQFSADISFGIRNGDGNVVIQNQSPSNFPANEILELRIFSENVDFSGSTSGWEFFVSVSGPTPNTVVISQERFRVELYDSLVKLTASQIGAALDDDEGVNLSDSSLARIRKNLKNYNWYEGTAFPTTHINAGDYFYFTAGNASITARNFEDDAAKTTAVQGDVFRRIGTNWVFRGNSREITTSTRTRVADNETAAAAVPKAITLDEALEDGYDLEIIFNDTAGPHSHAKVSCDAILDLTAQSSVPGNTGDAISEKIQRMNSTGLGSNAQATLYIWRGNSNSQIYFSATQDGNLDFEMYKSSRGGRRGADGADGTIYQFIKQVSDIPSSPAAGTILKISTEITTGFSNFVDESNTAVTTLSVGEGYVRVGTNWVRNYVAPAGGGGGGGQTVKKLFEHTADQDDWGNAAWSNITLTSAPTTGNELHITIWDGTKFLFDEVIPVEDYLAGNPQTNNNSTINGNVFRWVVSDPGSSASAAVTDLVNIGRGNSNGTTMRFWTTSNKWDGIRVKVEEVTIGGSSGEGQGQTLADAGPWLPESEVGSSTTEVTFSPTPIVSAYTDGLRYVFQAQHDYVAGLTINLSGLGAKSLVAHDNTALATGDIVEGQVVSVRFDLANDRWVGVDVGDDAPDVQHFGILFTRSATQPTLTAANLDINVGGALVLPSGYGFNQIPTGTANVWSITVTWSGEDANTITLGGFVPIGDHEDTAPALNIFTPGGITRQGVGVAHRIIQTPQMNKFLVGNPNARLRYRIRGSIGLSAAGVNHININLSDGVASAFNTTRFEAGNLPANNVDIVVTRAVATGINLSQLQVTMEVVGGASSTNYTFNITSIYVYAVLEQEIDDATETTSGLMPSADKTKVNALNLAYNVRRPHDILWDFGNPLVDSRFNVEALGRINYVAGLSITSGDLVTMPNHNIYRANESMTTPAIPDYTKWTYIMGFENIAGQYGCVKLGDRYDDARLVVTVPEDFDWQNCRLDMHVQATKNLANASNGFLIGLGANTPTINDNLITLYNRGVGVFHHTWHSGSPTMHIQEMDGTANTITRSEGSLELQGDLALFHGSVSQEWLYHDNADSGYAWDYDRTDYILSMEFQDDTLTYYWNYDRIGFPQPRVRYQYASGNNPMLPASNPDNHVIVHYLADGNTDNSFIRIFKLRIRELYRSERP